MFALGRLRFCALVSFALLSACSSDEKSNGSATQGVCAPIAPSECPDPAPHYADVAPIIEQRCSSCHTGAKDAPWPLDDYEDVADWATTIREELLLCKMPPADSGVTMTPEERDTILVWIRCNHPE